MGLEEFLAEERAEGRRVAQDASFTLDPAQVRVRLATFCSEFRLYPLFRCLQAIHRVTESDLFIRFEDDCWKVSFHWRASPESSDFEDLIADGASAAFDHLGTVTTQHFFFGLSAALGAPHYRLHWTSPKGSFKVKDGLLSLVELRTDEAQCQLAFSVDEGWWSRLTGGSGQKTSTETELRARLAYSSVAVHLEGQQLEPAAPVAPETPWASQMAKGSSLACRFLPSSNMGRLRPPEYPLDHYRSSRKGKAWDLTKDDSNQTLPLSIQLGSMPDPPTLTPQLGAGKAARLQNHDSGDLPLSEAALFLSLEAGRRDWLFPVRDGLLGEPISVELAKGGLVALLASEELQYDLSGMRLVENAVFEEKLSHLRSQGKALKRQLSLSLANISIRAESLPGRYDQAVSYLVGGPYFGMLGGKLGPKFRKWFAKKRE